MEYISPEVSAYVYKRDWTNAMNAATTKEERDLVVKMFLQCAPITYSPEFKTEKMDEASSYKEERKPKEKFDFKSFFKKVWEEIKLIGEVIKKQGFYYLFIFVAILLVGFTTSIGVYNCYAGKMICIFFFVCALVGGALNFFVSSDFLKGAKIKSRESYVGLAIIVTSICLSLLAFYIFYILQKEKPESLTGPGPIYGISIAVSIFVATVTILLAFFIKKKKEK